ncbi:MAG: aspartate aminotransferase family protein [Deltaproteobacteria bacterium]|nr:aspartate aminotransferase family protein [Deltaproteobacteria bacterium]
MDDLTKLIKGLYPYDERYGVLRAMPERGMSYDHILGQIREMAQEENRDWETGKCSGSLYCGDHDHYRFLDEVFAAFSYVNSLQRDMCPSMTRFESEIIAMSLDLMHGDAVSQHDPSQKACGAVTFGGTESIINPLLCYRDRGRKERGITAPKIIIPDTAHPAFNKGAHLLGLEVVTAPVDPQTTQVDVGWVADRIDAQTIAIVGSAGNYPYGTIDPIAELSELAVAHNVGLHVDGCLGGFILPWGEVLGYDVPVFDFRLPGVTSISADTHKYGYGLKGTSVALYRDASLRKYQYFVAPAWKGGAYVSNGLAGSRSGGLIAATWASMVSHGREGYLRRARKIFETAARMTEVVASHPELKLMGKPTFCLSFRSDDFDIYHLNDFMKERGWRFNGQQNPSALHMAVTGPQTRPGVMDSFAEDLADAVPYARSQGDARPQSSAIYGGGASGLPIETPEQVRDLLEMALDVLQAYPF